MIAAADGPAGPAFPGPVLAGPSPDVSRETDGSVDPGEPELNPAARVFLGPAFERLASYARLLAGPGTERGLIGPREVPRLWDRHLLNCAVVADLVPQAARVDDIGSGAGLPGVVLALLRPDLEVTLVEPLLRRTVFLDEVVAQLDLGNVRVVRMRAEDRAREVTAGGRAPADVVTVRAVAPLARLAGWCLPLLRDGGLLLAFKGASAQAELDEAGRSIARAGGHRAELLSVGTGIVDPPTTVVRVVRRASAQPGRRGRR